MTYVGYILRSEKTFAYYVGQTDNLERRLDSHNKGQVQSTKPYRPWKLVLSKNFSSRRDAMAWEKEVKGRKSRAFIEKLIQGFISERSAAR